MHFHTRAFGLSMHLLAYPCTFTGLSACPCTSLMFPAYPCTSLTSPTCPCTYMHGDFSLTMHLHGVPNLPILYLPCGLQLLHAPLGGATALKAAKVRGLMESHTESKQHPRYPEPLLSAALIQPYNIFRPLKLYILGLHGELAISLLVCRTPLVCLIMMCELHTVWGIRYKRGKPGYPSLVQTSQVSYI